MTAIARGVGVSGIEGRLVDVQVCAQDGMPGMDVTGLATTTIREARFRVRSALKTSGYGWPQKRLLANFAPADLPKRGTAYDLPLAVAVLVHDGRIKQERVQDTVFFGELALNGNVRPCPGAVNAALAARDRGIRTLVAAGPSADEAAAVPGIDVIAVRTIVELVEHFQGATVLEAVTPTTIERRAPAVDLAHVRGQVRARRALEVAAAGGHNLLMVGPPGCGKTLLARSMPGILPPLTMQEALDVARVHSISTTSRRRGALSTSRPFRAPHSSASHAALVGGGNPPMPGEVSLAHHGVLFLDEVAEFSRRALDSLRAPLEDRAVTVSRAASTMQFPASIALVCAMNPCPCGHHGDPRHDCRCPQSKIDAYRDRLSGPLIDRIDIVVPLMAVDPEDLMSAPAGESSAVVRERVVLARCRQQERNQVGAISWTNAAMPLEAIDVHAALDAETSAYLGRVGRRIGLSARSWHRAIRVARTLADLSGDQAISRRHIAEALTYRRLDWGYFAPSGPSGNATQVAQR
ncbi:MAG: magnesium chelatase family protein [Myxococcota bacterium]|jgi:magnesium chelatase family protein